MVVGKTKDMQWRYEMFKLDEKILFQPKENDVLAVGELLVDMISDTYDDSVHNTVFHKFFGGSPANIAMNTKKLGIQSLIASAIGNDGFGYFLDNYLREEHMDTSYIQKVEQSTSMVVVTKSKQTPLPIFYRGADYQLTYSAALERALLDSKIVHFSSWPISMSPGRETIERVIQVAKEKQILVCFDPNYHPKLWEQGVDGVAYTQSIISHVDIIKPSEDDAERLFGHDCPEKQIEKFLHLGAKLVIMTLGKDGVIVSNGEETIRCPSYAKKIVDTTGAGDAFWSGFYSAIVKGHTIKEAVRLGSAVSAYKLQYMGAVVNLPKLEKIVEHYQL